MMNHVHCNWCETYLGIDVPEEEVEDYLDGEKGEQMSPPCPDCGNQTELANCHFLYHKNLVSPDGLTNREDVAQIFVPTPEEEAVVQEKIREKERLYTYSKEG